MYPHQRPQPLPPGVRLRAISMPVGQSIPSGFPSNQLPGNAPNPQPQFAYQSGFIQGYPAPVMQQQRLLISPSANPDQSTTLNQQQQGWQQVVLSPYQPQHTGETVILQQGSYQQQVITPSTVMDQTSQTMMISPVQSSQTSTRFNLQHALPSEPIPQHSIRHPVQFSQVRFQPPGGSTQMQTSRIEGLPSGSVMFLSQSAPAHTNSLTSVSNNSNGYIQTSPGGQTSATITAGNPIFIQTTQGHMTTSSLAGGSHPIFIQAGGNPVFMNASHQSPNNFSGSGSHQPIFIQANPSTTMSVVGNNQQPIFIHSSSGNPTTTTVVGGNNQPVFLQANALSTGSYSSSVNHPIFIQSSSSHTTTSVASGKTSYNPIFLQNPPVHAATSVATGAHPAVLMQATPAHTSTSTIASGNSQPIFIQANHGSNLVHGNQILVQPTPVNQVPKIGVPWSWTRRVGPEGVFYLSPGGNEMRSLDEVREYLLKDGTCKCGLECPLDLEKTFSFDPQRESEQLVPSSSPPNPSRYCSHKSQTASMATWEETTGNQINHVMFQPAAKGGSKFPTRKKKPLSGILTEEMIEAKEIEKKRINEIILEQKREYEAQMSFSVSRTTTTTSTSTTNQTQPDATTKSATTTTTTSSDASFWNTTTFSSAANATLQDETQTNIGSQQNTFLAYSNSRPNSAASVAAESNMSSVGLTNFSDASSNDDSSRSVATSSNVARTSSSPHCVVAKPTTVSSESHVRSGQSVSSKSTAKNIEIRRMSSTEEGDKILNSAWDSPEKEEKGQTPLEMVESIISNIEMVEKNDQHTPTKKGKRQPTEPPSWVTTPRRPLPSSQTQRPNFNPPSSVPNMSGPRMGPTQSTLMPAGGSGGQLMNLQPPVLQLVNTVNGPVLVPEGTQLQHVNQDTTRSKMSSKVLSPVQTPPKLLIPSMQPSHPILVSPGHQLIAITPQQQVGKNGQQSQHHILMNQTPQMMTSGPMILANGMLAMPAPQGIVYNQLPDGSLVQVQTGQMPTTILSSPMPILMNPGQAGSSGQLMSNPGGTLLLSPSGGLLQMQSGSTYQNSGGFVSVGQGQVYQGQQQQQQQVSPQQMVTGYQGNLGQTQSTPTKSPQEKTSGPSIQSNPIEDDDSDDEPLYASNDDESDEDDEDDATGDDEEISRGKNSAIFQARRQQDRRQQDRRQQDRRQQDRRRTIIQSNKVDSSGLKATPPHNPDETDPGSSSKLSMLPDDLTHTQQDGNDSLEMSGSSLNTTKSSPIEMSPSKRRRKRNVDQLLGEEIQLEESSEDETPIRAPSYKSHRHFKQGEVVWGPHGAFPSWPGKIISLDEKKVKNRKVRVFWFGSRESSDVDLSSLKSLSEGLEDHHRERKKLRKGRKMNASLEKAIQEAMADLDRMS